MGPPYMPIQLEGTTGTHPCTRQPLSSHGRYPVGGPTRMQRYGRMSRCPLLIAAVCGDIAGPGGAIRAPPYIPIQLQAPTGNHFCNRFGQPTGSSHNDMHIPYGTY